MKVLASCAIGLAGLGLAWAVLTSEQASPPPPPVVAAPAPPTAEQDAARQAVEDYHQAMSTADQQTLCGLAARAADAHRKAGSAEGAAFWAQVSTDRCSMTG